MSETFERGKDIYIEFFDKRLKGTYTVNDKFEGKEKTRSLIAFPKESQYKDFVLDTPSKVFVPKDKDGNPKEGKKTIHVYANANYKITKTPRGEDGKFDYSKQEVHYITGEELEKEMNAWKTNAAK